MFTLLSDLFIIKAYSNVFQNIYSKFIINLNEVAGICHQRDST